MRLSAFNVRVPAFPSQGETLVYNTLTGASAVLDEAELAGLEQGLGEAELVEQLADADVGILTESREAEERELAAWYAARREATGKLSVAVSTSFACNFACTYCYQDAYLDGQVMSPAVADGFARWCEERMRETGARRLHLNVLGGEPLLHPALVERLGKACGAAAAACGGTFSFTLVTNGSLLTPAVVDRLLPLGLEVVQISLDGDEASHDLTRPSRKGQGTFRQVWANLVAIAGRVKIALSGTYLPESVAGFPKLLSRLRDAGLSARDISKIAWKPALAGAGAVPGSACGGSWADAEGWQRLWLAEAIREAGFEHSPLLELGPCGIHNTNHFAVDPLGRIYECPGFVGHPEWAIGDVERGIDPTRRARSRPADPMASCGACAWRPSCGGGCLAVTWLEAGKAEGVNCEAGYFADVAPGALRRGYALEELDGEARAAVLREIARAPERQTGTRRRLPVLRGA